jgi:hypothetical protein
VKRLPAPLLKAWLISLLVVLGCDARTDRDWQGSETIYKLEILAKVLSKSPQSEAMKLRSISELVSSATKKNLLADVNDFTKDGWGSVFVLQADGGRLRVISAGPNRVLENGHGDDIYFEITFGQDGNQGMRRNYRIRE